MSSSTLSSSSSQLLLSNPPQVQHVSDTYLTNSTIRKERTKVLVDALPKTSSSTSDAEKEKGRSIFYVMQRDVRTVDNWALALASHLATLYQLPLQVLYALPPPPPSTSSSSSDTLSSSLVLPDLVNLPMTARHADFVLGGLQCVHSELKELHIPLHIAMAPSHNQVGDTLYTQFQLQDTAAIVVCDMNPLRQYREWMELQLAPLLLQAQIPLWQVDAHNIVPVWTAAPSRQVGARTLRPKIHNVLQSYLQKYPKLEINQQLQQQKLAAAAAADLPVFDRARYEHYLQLDTSVAPVTSSWAQPGSLAAQAQFERFLKEGLPKFDQLRNDPTQVNICSNLSPWINQGHISFQRLVVVLKKLNKYANGTAAFIEEGVIRRELSDNFVYYTPNDYDQLTAAAGWAQETLQEHASDPREYLYSCKELETAHTHDDLWNAAQFQLTREGKMHGFLRMYWAKKILEWTPSPQVALKTAQYFNDKYALDGRDPNGFVGVGWSIMGIHDMGWAERNNGFGKIRYMNYAGCKRKFRVPLFVAKYKGAAENAAKASRAQSVGGAQEPATKKLKQSKLK